MSEFDTFLIIALFNIWMLKLEEESKRLQDCKYVTSCFPIITYKVYVPALQKLKPEENVKT